jgi:hypothetical protein
MPRSRRSGPPGSDPNAARFAQWLLDRNEESALVGTPLLTEAGVVFLRGVVPAPARARGARSGPGAGAVATGRPLPRWDANERRLWLATRLLKEFRRPAPNQTALLDAFQARGWACRHVSNPLAREPGENEIEAQERLHETIKSLNKGMPRRTIHFRGDGSGHGVWWDYAPPSAAADEPPPPGDGSAETRF